MHYSLGYKFALDGMNDFHCGFEFYRTHVVTDVRTSTNAWQSSLGELQSLHVDYLVLYKASHRE